MSDHDSTPLSAQLRAMAAEMREQADEARVEEEQAALEGEVDSCGPDLFALTLAAFHERLDRIENLLGLTEPTPAQALLDFFLGDDQ